MMAVWLKRPRPWRQGNFRAGVKFGEAAGWLWDMAPDALMPSHLKPRRGAKHEQYVVRLVLTVIDGVFDLRF